MVLDFARDISKEAKLRGYSPLYIRSLVKEYFQVLVLYFVYTTEKYNSRLIFTGGTCLRHFWGLERLSEDLDFDFITAVDINLFVSEMQSFFEKDLNYKELNISIKQQGKQILLKFPVLRDLGLASRSESDLLYIKCDIEKVIGTNNKTQRSTKSAFGYNFVALHYDLSTLFAGKVTAILTRNLLSGSEDRQTIKGRDFYDLMWYLKQNVPVNFESVRDRLNNSTLSFEEMKAGIVEKVHQATTTYKSDFKNDLLPFISDTKFLNDYVDNYADEFGRYELRMV